VSFSRLFPLVLVSLKTVTKKTSEVKLGLSRATTFEGDTGDRAIDPGEGRKESVRV